MPERRASSAESTEQHVSVLLPLPLAGAYDYRVPATISVAPGDFVTVPLGGRILAGVVWGTASGEVAATKLKSIVEKLAAPALSEELRKLVDWVANYTLSPPCAAPRPAATAYNSPPNR